MGKLTFKIAKILIIYLVASILFSISLYFFSRQDHNIILLFTFRISFIIITTVIMATIFMHIIHKYDTIKSSLFDEQVILIKEMNHRIKNNIDILTNIMDMKMMLYNDKDVNAVLTDLKNKAFLISIIHEKIYKSLDFKNIDFGSYLKDVIDSSNELNNSEVDIIYNIDDIRLNAKIAINIVLIIQELFVNAIKHGFGDKKDKIFEITLRKDDSLFLTLKDNGTGFDISKLNKVETFGIEMIKSIVSQYGGTIDIESSIDGTTITFNLEV